MSMAALVQKREELEAKRKALHAIFEEAGPELDLSKVTSIEGDTLAKATEIRKRNEELTALAKEIETLQGVLDAKRAVEDAERYLTEPQGRPPLPAGGKGQAQAKSLGEIFVESKAYKERAGSHGPEATLDVELKTLFATGNGWAPETTRTGRVVEFATRPIQVTDVIPQTTTTQTAVVYMEETTFTNAAAETAEGGLYPEAALELTEKQSPVKKIAVYLPVTDEQLQDVPQARGYVDNRLRFMLQQRLDAQILVGDGTGANLTGILNTVGIQTQAKGLDPTPDAIYKAMTKIRVTGRAMPGVVILHPNDWQEIRLLRTADGLYIWGSPSEAGPERIWGLPVVQADAITENTGLVGDFANFSELATRRGIDVQVSNSHADFFINGKLAIRADVRVALVVYRPAAFCTISGL